MDNFVFFVVVVVFEVFVFVSNPLAVTALVSVSEFSVFLTVIDAVVRETGHS